MLSQTNKKKLSRKSRLAMNRLTLNRPANLRLAKPAKRRVSYNIRIAPVTVLIDRQGRIRATGLRVEQLGNALEMLLAEQAG